MEFVNRDFNAAISTRRHAVPETRPEELTQSNVLGQPLMPEFSKQKLKSITGGRSNVTGKRP